MLFFLSACPPPFHLCCRPRFLKPALATRGWLPVSCILQVPQASFGKLSSGHLDHLLHTIPWLCSLPCCHSSGLPCSLLLSQLLLLLSFTALFFLSLSALYSTRPLAGSCSLPCYCCCSADLPSCFAGHPVTCSLWLCSSLSLHPSGS